MTKLVSIWLIEDMIVSWTEEVKEPVTFELTKDMKVPRTEGVTGFYGAWDRANDGASDCRSGRECDGRIGGGEEDAKHDG